MDLYAIFPSPVQTVFGHLADPGRLGDWLPGISAAAIGSATMSVSAVALSAAPAA